MTFSKLKIILKQKIKDHNITLDWIINTHRPHVDKERVENRIEVYEEILEIISGMNGDLDWLPI